MVLSPFINQPFATPVWRMEIDEITDTLFLELRDNGDKQVSFAAINLHAGYLNFKDLQMPERWLSGIEAAQNGVLLLHGYQNQSAPVHKGLTAVDGLTAETLWADYNITFNHLTQTGFAVYDARIQPKKLFFIDARTGEWLNHGDVSPSDNIGSQIILPQILQAKDLPSALLPLPPHANVVHYLNHNNFRIVSLHALIAGKLTQQLYVWDSTGGLIFEDVITDKIQKLQPEAFISYKNKLIWLKDRSEVKVLNL